MYFIKYGKEYLHDPRTDDCVLFDLSIDGEENTSGFCDFTIYPNHKMYDKLKERDTENQIEVYDDAEIIFAGFIYELGKEFQLDGHVKCKGELAYLEESIVRPYSTVVRGYGDKAPDTFNGYFEWLIRQHNSQVGASKQFTVGINNISSLVIDNLIFMANNKYPSTFKEIKEKILDVYGGCIRTRHENGIRYIDFLAEWADENSQILDFGVNLTDYTQTDNSLDVVTFVVPLGATVKETEYEYDDGYFTTSDSSVNPNKEYYTRYEDGGYSKCNNLTAFEAGTTYYEYDPDNDESELPITISSIVDAPVGVPDYTKYGDYIYCESAVKKYGYVGVTYEDSELKTKEELLVAGIKYLQAYVAPLRTIEIKAIDMHLVNPDIKAIKIGDYVRVRSKPHNFDSYMLCRKIDLDLNKPDNSLYTLGTTFDTLTGEQNKRIKQLNSAINTVYEKAAAIGEEAKSVAKEALNKLANLNGAFVHVRYSHNSDGSDMTELPANDTLYIGICSNGTEEAPTDNTQYVWSRIVGNDGVPGSPGADGQSSYLHIKYSPDGINFSDDSGETPASWIGTCITVSQTDPTTFSSYTWKKIEGDPGEAGPQGSPGEQGDPGETGVSVTSVTRYYQLAVSTPASVSNSTVTPPSPWTETEPEYIEGSTDNLYFVDRTVYSDSTRTYSTISLSSSYEAAKQAYDLAKEVETAYPSADDAKEDIITEDLTTALLDLSNTVSESYSTKQDLTDYGKEITAILEGDRQNVANQFILTGNLIEEAKQENGDKIDPITRHIKLDETQGITISSGDGETGLALTLDSENGIIFSKNGVQFGLWDGNDFYTGNIVVRVQERAQLGNFSFIPRGDGSLMFLKVGD